MFRVMSFRLRLRCLPLGAGCHSGSSDRLSGRRRSQTRGMLSQGIPQTGDLTGQHPRLNDGGDGHRVMRCQKKLPYSIFHYSLYIPIFIQFQIQISNYASRHFYLGTRIL